MMRLSATKEKLNRQKKTRKNKDAFWFSFACSAF